jgi:hypothetical protein
MVRSGFGYAEVSRLVHRPPYRVFDREVKRAIFWGGVLPIVSIAGTFVHPIALFLLAAYPVQFLRTGLKARAKGMNSWTYAWLLMIGKFAEAQGVLQFYWNLVTGLSARPIEYKGRFPV